MQASSNPLDPRAVLGAVKAQPGNAGARRKPSATAGLDRPCAARSTFCGPGRRNGPWLEHRNCAISGASDDVTLSTVSSRGLREDKTKWRIGLPGACEHW
jgi:hypothetical protein